MLPLASKVIEIEETATDYPIDPDVGHVVSPVDLDQRIEPAEALPVKVRVEIE
jgi:hypothetical protein